MRSDAVNENCRGCGARITREVCPYCRRPYDPKRDRLVRDPRDDPKRKIEPRKVEQ
jgi:hypothetical protein